MWSTDLALTNSNRYHTPHGLSWTKTNHLAKVSDRYLQRPESLRLSKKDLFFLCKEMRTLEKLLLSWSSDAGLSLQTGGGSNLYFPPNLSHKLHQPKVPMGETAIEAKAMMIVLIMMAIGDWRRCSSLDPRGRKGNGIIRRAVLMHSWVTCSLCPMSWMKLAACCL